MVDGKPYSIALRFKRDYKPYTVQLIDVRKDDYLGTDTPRNYSSDVRILDPAHHVDREVHIWMNNPLRYAGDTLYQSGYHPGPPETTTLQVVKNTGWMIPYVGCMIVATGMLAHFSLTLTRFLRRRDAEELAADDSADSEAAARHREIAPPQGDSRRGRRSRSRWIGVAIPAAVVVVLAGWLASKAVEPAPAEGRFPLLRVRQAAAGLRGADQAVRHAGPQRAADSFGPPDPSRTKPARPSRQPAGCWTSLPAAVRRSSIGYCTSFNPEVLATVASRAARAFPLFHRGFAAAHGRVRSRDQGSSEDVKPASMSIYQKKLLDLNKKLNLCRLLMARSCRPRSRKNIPWTI